MFNFVEFLPCQPSPVDRSVRPLRPTVFVEFIPSKAHLIPHSLTRLATGTDLRVFLTFSESGWRGPGTEGL